LKSGPALSNKLSFMGLFISCIRGIKGIILDYRDYMNNLFHVLFHGSAAMIYGNTALLLVVAEIDAVEVDQ
jgi:hypothetical protein